MMCEKCIKNGNCEYVPYDVDCDNNYEEKLTREEMMNKAINKLGMEHPWVVALCHVCEWYPTDKINEARLREAYKAGMAKNWAEEEE